MSSIELTQKKEFPLGKVNLLNVGAVKPSKVILYTFLAFVALVQVYPLIYLFFFSLKDNGEILGGNVLGLPHNWLWSNYRSIFGNSDMPLYFFNSALITSISIIAVLILGGTAAYAIQRMKWRFSKLVLIIFLLGIMIPQQSSLLPLFINFSRVNLTDSYMALIIPYVAYGLPVAIYIFTSFFESIPLEMEESGALEGCSIIQIFFYLIFPMVKPAVATIAILTYRGVWNELLFAFIFITKKAYKTVPVGLMTLEGRYSVQWGPMGAALLIAALPSLILYFVLSKQVQDSMVAGAIKG